MNENRACACVAINAYDCWAARYRIRGGEFSDDLDGMEVTTRELVDADGGPCECSCHHEEDDGDDYE